MSATQPTKASVNNPLLSQEWIALQNQFDSYEKHSLLIKLFAITWLIVSVILSQLNLFNACIGLAVGAIIWLQDAIWKTFQSRIETRILNVETSIAENSNIAPCQFNREFLAHRAGAVSTLISYLKQALRPTIAYPHIAILAMMIALHFI